MGRNRQVIERGQIMHTAIRGFKLGQVVTTFGVNDRIADDIKFAKFVTNSLRKYCTGDWGDMCKADKKENDFAVEHGHLRIFASYECNKDIGGGAKALDAKIWIITEADRSATTILFPEEY